jgi:hypothetical protein
MDGLPRNPRANIYESLQVGQMTKLPLALKLRYKLVALLFITRPRLCRSPRLPDASPAIAPRVRRH